MNFNKLWRCKYILCVKDRDCDTLYLYMWLSLVMRRTLFPTSYNYWRI